MSPRLIDVKCPKCRMKNKPIPADMGDKTFKCKRCGRFIHYGHRKQKITIIERPERATSSGLTLY